MSSKLNYLTVVSRDKERKPWRQIATELAQCTLSTRRIPAHYITSFLYRREAGQWQDYLDRQTMDRIWSSPQLHHPLGTKILQNKLFFDYYYRDAHIALPRTLGYCSNGYVFSNAERALLDKLPQMMEAFLQTSTTGSVFIKPLDGINGLNCRRFDWDDLNFVDIHNLRTQLVQGNFIIQETLLQHPNVSRIYPHAVNTLRMDTYVRANGEVEVISGLMRFGMHGRNVDNGGCFISVALDQGTLAAKALCFIHLGGGVYEFHPNTNEPFKGFAIPFFAEAKDLVVRAAKLLPSRLVGWDVAITTTGPVLIEGNHNYHLGMSDTAYGGYRRNPRFQEVLRMLESESMA